jgi:hypothetical protein
VTKIRAPRVKPRRPAVTKTRAAKSAKPVPRAGVLSRVRKICLALPDAHEKIAWGAPTFRIRDRQFAMFLDNHHGDGRLALWCKAPPGAQEALVRADPGRFFVPPYVGPAGWLGIHLDKGLDWGVIAGLVRDGYLEAAPKRLRAALETA